MQTTLLFAGSAVIVLWGIGHLVPTRSVVAGFGALSADNARILTMEWVIEGLTLCFLGLLVAAVTVRIGADAAATALVARLAALMLLVLAAVSALTGARTSILPMRLCPYVKSAVALAYLAATAV